MIINVLMVKGNAEISHDEELMSKIITTRKIYDFVIKYENQTDQRITWLCLCLLHIMYVNFLFITVKSSTSHILSSSFYSLA